jgi:hypothetical protein
MNYNKISKKNINVIILFFLMILFIFCILKIFISIDFFHHSDYFTNLIDILFLSKDELYSILKNNNDHYYNKFYKNDFKVRNINNINEYIYNIKNYIEDMNDEHKIKLKRCIEKVNKFLNNIKKDWFNGIKANNIKWIVGMNIGKYYENGLPHTRDNIIILSKEHIETYSDNKLIKTLIHEKVHLYQKIYKDDVDIYIKKNNFTKIKLRTENDNIRANPDLDNWIYKDNNNNILKATYNNNASSIEDIQYSPINIQSYEHPFEKMAIEIENLYV